MNAIIGFATLAVSNIDDQKRVRDYLGKILSSSNHLLSLINDVLDMSKIESGKISFREEPFNFAELVGDVVELSGTLNIYEPRGQLNFVARSMKPAGAGDLIGTQFEAASELGIRMHCSRGSMDLSVKDGGLPPDSVVQTVDEIMTDSARLIEKYHDTSYGAMHRIALAPCSPFSVSAELLRQSAILARQYGVRLHTHLCETKDEENFMLAREGVRPLAYMEKLGWLGSDVWFAHGIHFNDEELRVLAKTGTGVAHCPISNMKLSSGIARIPEMLELGVPVGLAVDGSASNDGSSLMEELRVAFLLHRLNASRRAPTGYDVLKMATRGSARLLGRDDIGQLAVGKCADLFMIDSRRLELVGSCFDPKSVLGTVGVRGPVDYTVVHGRVTVAQGHLMTVDEERLAQDAETCCRQYLAR